MKWLGLALVWIRQNHSIRSNVLIQSNKYLVSELRNSMDRIFSRIPSPILTKKLKETSKTKERDKQLTKRRGLNRNKSDPPKKILLLPFFRKKGRIRKKSMKQKRSE
ncbi:hypothetical protein HYC85_002670 [Camellia sinensis]|uniref:Protein TIC 214 n=1 Tax=Camellia sinensis TaxID=4442 RepID=A0A7J7IA72_CAMSI|nr:hypothetical protein HYC85_002670 [Camellia sinensis]